MKRYLLTVISIVLTLTVGARQLAFPGAEGFGAFATGGRGGEVVHVTNLNADGPGSLAEAVSRPHRIVVFDVAGVIDITGKSIVIADSITIAGQTAPGEGITIYGGRVIMTHKKNIIVRYLRMRGSIKMPRGKCTLTMDYCSDVIMDHCSVSWGRWDNVHIKDARNITWQNCIIAEGIAPQRFGAITDGTDRWTVARCLWMSNKSRNPKMKCGIQYINNVVYNCLLGVVGGHSAGNHYQDVINNYFVSGPTKGKRSSCFSNWTKTDHLYAIGNIADTDADGKLNGTPIEGNPKATKMEKPNFEQVTDMITESAATALRYVLKNAGASLKRDVHDRRLIKEAKSFGKKGKLIDDESQVGGMAIVKTGKGKTPKDTDRDGMPDKWEKKNGLKPGANDAAGDADNNGYTNIEEYINSLAR